MDQLGEAVLIYEGAVLALRRVWAGCPLPTVTQLCAVARRVHPAGVLVPVVVVGGLAWHLRETTA